MDSLTPTMNQQNVEYVRTLIDRATGDQPYFANSSDVMQVTTDMDHHPYTRWYRGVYYFPEPIIMEREAGYREPHNNCYTPSPIYEPDDVIDVCFEPACSTIFPCHTTNKRAISEKQNTNNVCIVKNY